MYTTTRARRRVTSLVAVGALAVALVACGDDDDAETTDAPATTEAPAATPAPAATDAPAGTTAGSMPSAHQMVQVEGVDYAFENLPESVPAGTMLSFTNGSDAEFHEMVVIRIPDEETRPVSELVTLPEEELDAIFGQAPPTAVFLAAPGEAGTPVPGLGDGTLTEPGRYAVVCFIPVGADPAAVAEAMQSTTSEPPDLGDGPPHASAGMVGEITVTDA